MRNKKKSIKLNWSQGEINKLMMEHLLSMMDCSTQYGVDVALGYARYMAQIGLNPDNYPIFFKILETNNHWVIDALLADHEPASFLEPVQPNTYILSQCFKLLSHYNPGGMYGKTLLVILYIISKSYEDAKEGNRLYPLTPEDINSIGKYLVNIKNQDTPVSRLILHILDRIAMLMNPGGLPPENKVVENVAIQANSIRGKFLDPSKKLHESIPVLLLKTEEFSESETKPSQI